MRFSALLKTICLATVVTLTGCAVPNPSDIFSSTPEKDYSKVYLRGVFNWWEVTEPFKFEVISEDLLAVEVELIADGQPYDFKVADAAWSPSYNCGLAAAVDALPLGDSIELYCYTDSLNLQFMPSETAMYRFNLDVSNQQYPKLTIQKIAR